MDINSLDLLSGKPIPIPELGMEFHQPKIKEIAFIGEDVFNEGIAVSLTNKEDYQRAVESQDLTPEQLEAFRGEMLFKTNYTLALGLMESNERSKLAFKSFLFLVFPKVASVYLDEISLILTVRESDDKKRTIVFTEEIFDSFSNVVKIIFATENKKGGFNTVSDKGAEIAAKIEDARKKLAKEKGLDKKKTSAIATSVSILSSISEISLIEILDYTLPQLLFQLERSKEYVTYRTQMTLGAFSGLKDVEIADWGKMI